MVLSGFSFQRQSFSRSRSPHHHHQSLLGCMLDLSHHIPLFIFAHMHNLNMYCILIVKVYVSMRVLWVNSWKGNTDHHHLPASHLFKHMMYVPSFKCTLGKFMKRKKTLQEVVLLLLTAGAVILYICIYICESEMQRMCEMTRCEELKN